MLVKVANLLDLLLWKRGNELISIVHRIVLLHKMLEMGAHRSERRALMRACLFTLVGRPSVLPEVLDGHRLVGRIGRHV